MPMPLSAKVNINRVRLRGAGSAETVNVTVPSWVNFTALSARFSSAARRRKTSADTIAGRSRAIVTSDLIALLFARAASAMPTVSPSARGENGSLRSTSPLASALAASTISVARAARWSAPLLTAFAHSRSRAPKSDVASSSARATIPVSGVRISCAIPARAASTARGSAVRAREDARRRLTTLLLRLRFAMSLPRSRQCHGSRAQSSPARRRIWSGDAPRARSSRNPVDCVDFESLWPSASRTRRW